MKYPLPPQNCDSPGFYWVSLVFKWGFAVFKWVKAEKEQQKNRNSRTRKGYWADGEVGDMVKNALVDNTKSLKNRLIISLLQTDFGLPLSW